MRKTTDDFRTSQQLKTLETNLTRGLPELQQSLQMTWRLLNRMGCNTLGHCFSEKSTQEKDITYNNGVTALKAMLMGKIGLDTNEIKNVVDNRDHNFALPWDRIIIKQNDKCLE